MMGNLNTPALWESFIPSKVSFFAWEAWHEKILTMDNLKRRGHTLVSGCYFCLEEEETINHFQLHCSVSQILWSLTHSLFRVRWVLQDSFKWALLSYKLKIRGKVRRRAWKASFFCILCSIQNLRNKLVFEDGVLNTQIRSKLNFIASFWSVDEAYIGATTTKIFN